MADGIAELFREGWTKIPRGLRGPSEVVTRPRARNLLRASQRVPPAVFKPIKQGGCHNPAQLKTQLAYLFQKSSVIIDPTGRHDGKEVLSDREIARVVSRWSDNWRGAPKLGHTTHLLMAYPRGTSLDQVAAITSEICAGKLQDDLGSFDYLIAVHDDRDHKHAHIVLNRRSAEGELFYLGREHRFNYDSFRQAMVETGERHGVRVEATRRVERGVMTWKAPIEEIYRARAEARAPVEEMRVGTALVIGRRIAEESAQLCETLSAVADKYQRKPEADRLISSAGTLRSGQALTHDPLVSVGEHAMSEPTLDSIVDRFNASLEAALDRIAQAAPVPRAEAQKQLVETLARIEQLQPIGDRSFELTAQPSPDGIYSAAANREDAGERLDDAALQARIAQALEGTGIGAGDVTARLSIGANSLALEREWESEDLRAVATAAGLDLARAEDLDEAARRFEAAQERLGQVLREAGIRLDHAGADEETQDKDTLESLRQELDAMRADRSAGDASGGAQRLDMPEDALRQALAEEVARLRAQGYSRAGISERSLEIDDAVLERYAARQALTEEAPEIAAILRQASRGIADALDAQGQARLIEQIREHLPGEDLRELEGGNASALVSLTDNRLEQLELARAYLQASKETAQGPAMERVLSELVQERYQVDASRDTDRGQTH